MSLPLPARLLALPAALLLFAGARCASHDADAASSASDSSPAATSANGPKVSAAKFCPALLANVKPYVKVPLGIVQANDETNDDLHTGEDGYVSCTYGHDPDGYRLTIGMHAGDVSKYEGTTEKGFVPLPGFGDKARAYEASIRWVDVVKGSAACEAIVTISNEDLTESDWKQAGGKMCNAAFALYH